MKHADFKCYLFTEKNLVIRWVCFPLLKSKSLDLTILIH